MAGRDRLLWVGQHPVPENLRAAVGDRWDLAPADAATALPPQLCQVPVAVVCPDGAVEDPARFSALLDELSAATAVAVLMLPPAAEEAWDASARRQDKLLCVREDASAAELTAYLQAAEAFQPVIANLQGELVQARDTAAGVTRTVEEVDEEMRLAAKLQRDFLPSRLPEVGPVRFGALLRPIGWVSGDLYDCLRLDETHVGFYVVDAVGHGMPAALLTMFIKKALQTKRIVGNTYQIVPPHAAMAELNTAICEQNLSSSHFCTSIYCVLDTESLQLTYCRAGHPPPLLVRDNGNIETLESPGSLLGVFPEDHYHSRDVRLDPGDRLVLFTDGAEDALCDPAEKPRRRLADVIAPWCQIPREEFLLRFNAAIDELPDGRGARDDITVLVADVEKTSAADPADLVDPAKKN